MPLRSDHKTILQSLYEMWEIKFDSRYGDHRIIPESLCEPLNHFGVTL